MLNLKNILVPVDFSESSRLALAYGRLFCAEYGSNLILLHVVESFLDKEFSLYDPLNMRKSMAQELVEPMKPELTEKIESHYHKLLSDLDYQIVFDAGDPSTVIKELVEEKDINLVIIGAHGQKGYEKEWLGTTAYNITRKVPCPVLTVKLMENEFIEA